MGEKFAEWIDFGLKDTNYNLKFEFLANHGQFTKFTIFSAAKDFHYTVLYETMFNEVQLSKMCSIL